jgi:hypothetical protein
MILSQYKVVICYSITAVAMDVSRDTDTTALIRKKAKLS